MTRNSKPRASRATRGVTRRTATSSDVEAEYERAAAIVRTRTRTRCSRSCSTTTPRSKSDFPDLQGSVTLLDEVDALVERFGLRRYLVVSRRLRSRTLCMQGDLAGAAAAMASIDDVFTEGFDAWLRGDRSRVCRLHGGNSDAVLRGCGPTRWARPRPRTPTSSSRPRWLRADALAWNGDIEGARRAVDRGEAAVAAEHYRETYWHGRLAMVGARVEADSAHRRRAASQSIGAIEDADTRAAEIVAAWETAVAQLARSSPLLDAYTMGIDAEVGRLRREDGRRPCTSRGRSLRVDWVAVLRDVLPLARGGGDVGRR